MIEIDINPVAFSIGPFVVRWYGVMLVLAVAMVIFIALREAKRVGISEEHIYSISLWAIIGGIVGSRLFHVIDQWQYYIAHPWQIIGFEGLTVYGAVIGAVLAMLIYTWINKFSFWQIGDIVAPGAIVGQAIGRVGCLINGCCYGLVCDLPWSIVYGNPSSYARVGIPVHPTQIYHIIWNLAGFAVLWLLRKRLKPEGSVFLLWLSLYAAGDLTIRLFREGEPFLFGMQQAQLIGVAILVVTVPLLAVRMWRARSRTLVTEPHGEVSQTEQSRGD